MSYSELSPVAVVPYDKDYIVDFVRYKTGWDQRGEVFEKAQISYLDHYLRFEHIDAKTIVVENEYIDRHYLEDYAEYYARCFPAHPKTCSRLHFFSESFDEPRFLSAVASEDEEFSSLLQDAYLGFAVIRPLPKTCIAKLCLRPYPALVKAGDYKSIKKRINVSLFGLRLTVETAPFLEQDKVVSACATSAIWTLLGATPQLSFDNLPSPSSITKSAAMTHEEGGRTFPTTGLTPPQVARSLKYFDLEPTLIAPIDGENFLVELKEYIHAYISSDIPVIIGGRVYDCTREDKAHYRGRHLVCALGYHVTASACGSDLNIHAHGIDRIYVHDDRYGPYVRLDEKGVIEGDEKRENWVYRKTSSAGINEEIGLTLEVRNGSEELTKREFFVPDILILGLYHKVRIPYKTVLNMHAALFAYVRTSKKNISATIDFIEDKNAKKYYKSLQETLEDVLSGSIAIKLEKNGGLKEEIRGRKDFYSFNGVPDKADLLTKSLPKYIWRCRISVKTSEFADVLIDATEIPQGQVIIGYISYHPHAERFWKYVEKEAYERAWDSSNAINEAEREAIGCFLRFFGTNKERAYLNSLYGPLGLPRRNLKPGEFDGGRNVTRRKDLWLIRRGDTPSWECLDQTWNYIWVINEPGDLIVAKDIASECGKYSGHPTLTDGNPARIGGELYFDGGWKINLCSRTYSGHLRHDSKQATPYLESVKDHNFLGLTVTMTTQKAPDRTLSNAAD